MIYFIKNAKLKLSLDTDLETRKLNDNHFCRRI